jgi:hypothetical protein
MSKNPKIEFYKIHLHPSKSDDITFRDIYSSIYNDKRKRKIDSDVIVGKNLFSAFFKYFFLKMEKGTVKNDKKRKAFKTDKKSDVSTNNSIVLKSENSFVHGRIKGGEYDTGKFLDDIENPDSASEKLAKNKLITDDFYFLLYTPLNKGIGILILQSYTKDNISDVFRPFIENLFKISGLSLKATTSVFMPLTMQEELKKNCFVEKFVFQNRYIVSDIEEQTLQQGEFTIKIEIKAHDKVMNLKNLPWWKRKLTETIIKIPKNEERELSTFNKQNGYLVGNNFISNPSRFSLDVDNITVKATILLENFIDTEENGVPKWNQLEDFALKALEEDVKPEVYPEDYTSEDL